MKLVFSMGFLRCWNCSFELWKLTSEATKVVVLKLYTAPSRSKLIPPCSYSRKPNITLPMWITH